MCEHGIVHLQTFAGTDFTDFRISLLHCQSLVFALSLVCYKITV